MADIIGSIKKLIKRIYYSESQILKDLKEGDRYDLGKIWQEDSIADIRKLDLLLLILLDVLRKEKVPLNRLTVDEILRHLHSLTENEESLMQRGARVQVKAIERLGPMRWTSNFRNEMAHLNAELSRIVSEIDHRQGSQLLRVINLLKQNENIYNTILKILSERNPDRFRTPEEVKEYIESAVSGRDALGVARLIDRTIGAGTFRTLSFLDTRHGSRSVYRLLTYNINITSFEKQVEKGLYLNLLENYGVQWDLEKVARDIVQNFFDANGQTMDGIKIEIRPGEGKYRDARIRPGEGKNQDTIIKVVVVYISAAQDYDWRELIHFGATTKQGSETAVGGFGEGMKIAAFVLIRDYGAIRVKASSRDWGLEYYFAPINPEAYRVAINGLCARKYNSDTVSGNSLEIAFSGDEAEKMAEVFGNARKLFYSSENPDFQGASYDDKATGGFKILPLDLTQKHEFRQRQKGRLYLAGQRTHFDNRKEWNTVQDLNIWTWKKVQPKDRDRGMITSDEMQELVLPIIVDSMPVPKLKQSVYDFKALWDKLNSYEVSHYLLEKIVDKLVEAGIILKFESIYLSNDLPWSCPQWISQGLTDKGFIICVGFLGKIGMKGARQQFLDWQSHSRVQTTPSELRKIEILQRISAELGLPEDEIKEVWIFTAEGEKSIVAGQYNPEFYWMSRESLQKPLLEVIHTYVHEAAHKDGSHGDASFDYGLQSRIMLIQQFTLDHREEWEEFEREWMPLSLAA